MKLSKYTKFREERFGGVLFETSAEKVFALNPTATAVVREIGAGGADEATVIRRIKDHFNDPDDVIGREIRAFIADLRQKGLIEE
jgi:Coenzyme PQQ synthesis protein D (PqqD)